MNDLLVYSEALSRVPEMKNAVLYQTEIALSGTTIAGVHDEQGSDGEELTRSNLYSDKVQRTGTNVWELEGRRPSTNCMNSVASSKETHRILCYGKELVNRYGHLSHCVSIRKWKWRRIREQVTLQRLEKDLGDCVR